MSYDSGNARLRARRSRLFRSRDYEMLLGRDLEGVLAFLGETRYGPEIRRALSRGPGLDALHRALRFSLGGETAALVSFYEGKARAAVEVLVRRIRQANAMVLVRGIEARVEADEIGALMVPLGDEALLQDLCRSPDLRMLLERMVVLDYPDRPTARRVLDAWPLYRRSGLAAPLEEAALEAWAETVRGLGDPLLQDALAREVDRRAVLAVLRRWEAAHSREAVPSGPLAGREAALMGARTRAEAAALLREPWRRSLARWVAGEPLPAVEEALERAEDRRVLSLFVGSDPLGSGIPLAYARAVEVEARNLRLVGLAASGRRSPADARERLLLVEEVA